MAKLRSFAELLARSVELYAERDAFRIRTREGFRSVSYAKFNQDVLNLAATLTSKGLAGDHLALVGENSYDWVVTYIATVVSGGVIVPIDKELTTEEMQTIVVESESRALFCSDDYSEVADDMKQTLDIEYFAINTTTFDGYTTLGQLIDAGDKLRIENPAFGQGENGDVERTASIVFTSGTTGFSKGVMLSRANLISNVESADEFIKLGDCVLSVLPMHHTYEFTLDILFSFYQGRTIAINNSIKYFAQNMKLFAPTDLLIVPLIAESLYATIWKNVQSQGKEATLRKAVKVSNLLLKVGIDLRRKLFGAVHEAFGGRLGQLFIGGAYLDPAVARGLRELGFKVYIGYGITECSPLVTGNITNRVEYMGSCGIPIPGVEIRISGQNDAGEGEIQVRGDSVMRSYYKNEQATAAVFDDGWFRTGDIGRQDKHGMLFITGRVKNLIVLKNGKNIYPEELESIIGRSDLVSEVVVRGSQNDAGEELTIVAEIFPNLELENPNIQTNIQTEIEAINSTLPYYKRIVRVKFRDVEFPKTTTKKIKRY